MATLPPNADGRRPCTVFHLTGGIGRFVSFASEIPVRMIVNAQRREWSGSEPDRGLPLTKEFAVTHVRLC
jgi:hypothetical protein